MNTTSINPSDLGIVNQLLGVYLEVNIWSASKKLKPQDLGEATLPPSELASLGSKKICDPEALKTFSRLKSQAVSTLERYGIRFLGGWTIPEHRASLVSQILDDIARQFNDAKEDFLANYDRTVNDWLLRHDEWSEIIENAIAPVDYVRSRIAFKSRIFAVALPRVSGEGTETVSEGFQDEVASIGQALFDDIARFATETWENCYVGKTEVSHKALSPLKTMHEKLVSFTFVEPHVSPVADLIETALNNMPKRGYIKGGHLLMLQGLILLLRDTSALAAHAKSVLEGVDPNDILAGFIPAEDDDLAAADEDNEADSDPGSILPAAQGVTNTRYSTLTPISLLDFMPYQGQSAEAGLGGQIDTPVSMVVSEFEPATAPAFVAGPDVTEKQSPVVVTMADTPETPVRAEPQDVLPAEVSTDDLPEVASRILEVALQSAVQEAQPQTEMPAAVSNGDLVFAAASAGSFKGAGMGGILDGFF